MAFLYIPLLGLELLAWLIILPMVIVIFFASEYNKPGWATFVFVGAMASLQYFTSVKVFDWVVTRPLDALLVLAAYFAIGTGWGIAKWRYFFLKKVGRKVREKLDAYPSTPSYESAERGRTPPSKNGEPEVWHKGRQIFNPTVADRQAYQAHLNEAADRQHRENRGAIIARVLRDYTGKESNPPLAREQKSRIMMWMAYWPISMTWTAINDPVKWAWREIWAALSGLFQGMADREFADIKA